MRLEGKTAIVTGGAGGIGEAIVRRFCEEGAKVVISDRSKESGEALAEELTKKGYQAAFCQTNVTSEEEVKNSVQYAVSTFGGLHILVNNAGVVEADTLLEDMPDAVWDKVLSVNLSGVFLNCKYALPELKKNQGCIICTSSTSGLVATRNDPAYCASKTGIIGLVRSIACDYARFGVRANAVCPTICDTPMFRSYMDPLSPEERKKMMDRLGAPSGRACTTAEVANTFLFLASDEASGISGAAVPVDIGYTAI